MDRCKQNKTSAGKQMKMSGFLSNIGVLMGNFEWVDDFVCIGGCYMNITQMEGNLLLYWTSWNRHDAHPCDVVGREGAEVLAVVVDLHLPIVDPCHCLHEICHSSSFIRTRLIDELIVDEGPYPFVLVHVGSDVQIHHAPPVELSWQVLKKIRHVRHGVSAMRVHLWTYEGVVRGQDEVFPWGVFLGFVHILNNFVFHGLVVVIGHESFPFVDLLVGVVEYEGTAVYESVALRPLEVAFWGWDVAYDEALLEEI